MDRNLDYKIAGIMSVAYAVILISTRSTDAFLLIQTFSFHLGIIAVVQILLMFIFPYVIYKLKNYLNNQYGYSEGNLFLNIVIISQGINITAIIIFLAGFLYDGFYDVSSFGFTHDMTNFLFIILMIRSTALTALGIPLFQRFYEANTILRIIAICLIIIGVHGVVLVLYNFLIGPIEASYFPLSFNVFDFLDTIMLLSQIIMFSLSGFIFIKISRENV